MVLPEWLISVLAFCTLLLSGHCDPMRPGESVPSSGRAQGV
jgi:hypothetical protein